MMIGGIDENQQYRNDIIIYNEAKEKFVIAPGKLQTGRIDTAAIVLFLNNFGIFLINDFMNNFQVMSERSRSSSTTSSHVFQFGLANQALDQSSCSTTHKMLPDIGFERSS